MKGIKKFTNDLCERTKSDFIISKGLQNEYHQFLGEISMKIKNGEITLDEYSKNVTKKILNS